MMTFNPYQGYQGQYYGYNQAMPDQLAQLRQQGSVQQNQPFQQAQTQTPDERIWVQGEAGAKAYMVAAGCTVALWDSEQQRIYLKSVNLNGVPMMQTLTYTFDSAPPVQNPTQQQTQAPMPDLSEYVTKEELEKRISMLIDKKEG